MILRVKVHPSERCSILIAESALDNRQAVGFPSPFEVSRAAPKCQKHHVSLGAEVCTRNLTRVRAEAGEARVKEHRSGEQTRELLIAGFVRRVKDESSHSSRPLSGGVIKKVGDNGLTRKVEQFRR